MSRTKKDREKSRHPWRENIEAMAMAIVVALLFKSFILEISKIPSGSMQPTLMGNPETQVFDRVLVDKLSFSLRDPQRWEIVVFKHPLERSRIMVKRLVGLPGEELRVSGGDLWTRRSSAEPWRILRRPPAVQEEMWRSLDVDEPLRSSWTRGADSVGWQVEGRTIEARGSGRATFREDAGAIKDAFVDGYPDALRGRIALRPEWGRNTVGDLRLRGEVRAEEGVELVRLELSEGARRYAFVLPGPHAGPADAPTIRVQEGEQPLESARGEPWHLAAGRWTDVAAINLDDRLALVVDGEELCALEIEAQSGRGSGAALALEGGPATFRDLMVDRDIYYTGARHGSSWEVEIPERSYVMLGDNTLDSADSRDWESVRMEFPGSGERVSQRGNFRGNDENPTRNRALGLTRFRDEWGEEHWFPTAEERQSLQSPQPLVPRELIQGRALAVFWPIKPQLGLWRLGWLH